MSQPFQLSTPYAPAGDERNAMNKDFDQWNELKKRLDIVSVPPLFREGEVWWCSVGLNIGYEVMGKHLEFTRPVLVLRKYNRHTFFGLPPTSKRKPIPAHYPLDVAGKQGSLLLDQGKTFDSRRLCRRMLHLSKERLQHIKEAFMASL